MRTRRGAATPTDSPQASTRWRTCCPRYLNKSQLGNLEESSDNASTRLGSQHGAERTLTIGSSLEEEKSQRGNQVECWRLSPGGRTTAGQCDSYSVELVAGARLDTYIRVAFPHPG